MIETILNCPQQFYGVVDYLTTSCFCVRGEADAQP